MFINIDGNYIALAAIRSIRRNGDAVKVEFSDGVTRY